MNHKVLTTNEMKTLDKNTCLLKNISSLQLMKQAGKALYDCLSVIQPLDKNKDSITVVSGVGNNGGDGLVVGKHLIENQYNVSIMIVGNRQKATNETNLMLNELETLKAKIIYCDPLFTLENIENIIKNSTVIIDGIFGIGLNRKIEGTTYQVIEMINNSQAFVFSIDIPSGLNGNSGNVEGIAVEASYTAIIQNRKIGNLLNDAKDYHGKTIVLDIGILQDKIESHRYLISPEVVLNKLNKRKHNTHKYHYGNVLTIGGSMGMTGAPIMSAYAALRCGCGLSTIAIASNYYSYVHSNYPELMIRPYQNVDELIEMLNKKNVVSFGPGLGRIDSMNEEVLKKLLDLDIPLVIDADGLFYLKKHLPNIKKKKNIIITPHVGEMARLLNVDSETILKDPLKAVETMIHSYHLTVVLKGPCTIIGNKAGIYFSNDGNPGMATAGSGDVLTGVIASFVGQGYDLLTSCLLGVSLHSKSGDLAKIEVGEHSLIATDIIRYIPSVLKNRK